MTQKVFAFFGQSKIPIVLAILVLTLCIGYIDHATGYDISLSILYLVPIALSSWRVNKSFGIFIAILSAFIWTGTNVLTGKTYLHTLIPLWNFLVRSMLFMVISLIITRLKGALDMEKAIARTDFVTNIPNQTFFYEIAIRELERAKRYNRPISVAYIDLDNFKSINDRLGHKMGDTLLCHMAQTIKDNIRAIDIVARFGGDEFVIFLPETTQESARAVIDRVRDLISKEAAINEWPITCSIGVATFTHQLFLIDDMIKRADHLMYKAKGSGKDRVAYEIVN